MKQNLKILKLSMKKLNEKEKKESGIYLDPGFQAGHIVGIAHLGLGPHAGRASASDQFGAAFVGNFQLVNSGCSIFQLRYYSGKNLSHVY